MSLLKSKRTAEDHTPESQTVAWNVGVVVANARRVTAGMLSYALVAPGMAADGVSRLLKKRYPTLAKRIQDGFHNTAATLLGTVIGPH